jgi:Ca2+-binding EF-hand superfamily protein
VHPLDEASRSGGPDAKQKIFDDEELRNMIDPILVSDDRNKDGFIDYPEFIAAQKKNQQPASD